MSDTTQSSPTRGYSLADAWKRIRVPYVLAVIGILPLILVTAMALMAIVTENPWAAMGWAAFSAPTLAFLVVIGLVNLWMYRRYASRTSFWGAVIPGICVGVWLVQLAIILLTPFHGGC